jgi:hypothetical protein
VSRDARAASELRASPPTVPGSPNRRRLVDGRGRDGGLRGERSAHRHARKEVALSRSRKEVALSRSRQELTAYAGVVASGAATALMLGTPWHWSALTGALLLACVPAGAAVMCWIDSGEGFAQAGLTLVVSLAVFALASAIMIWADAWHPWALLGLAGVGMASCLARLGRGAGR